MIDQYVLRKLSHGLDSYSYSREIIDGLVEIEGFKLEPILNGSFTFYVDGKEFVVLSITFNGESYDYEWVGDYISLKDENG